MVRYVALLYSVVLGDRRIKGSDLLALAGTAGLAAPKPVLASGNLLFETHRQPVAVLEERLDAAFLTLHGKPVPIMVRSAEDWARLAAQNPFPDESGRDGSLVGVRVQRDRLGLEVLEGLVPYQQPDERLAVVDGDLWVSFPVQMSSRPLLSALNPKRLGVGTMRNWNTVKRLAQLLANG